MVNVNDEGTDLVLILEQDQINIDWHYCYLFPKTKMYLLEDRLLYLSIICCILRLYRFPKSDSEAFLFCFLGTS